jgi:hypothetical protein
MLRIATRPNIAIADLPFSQLARNIFAEAIDEMEKEDGEIECAQEDGEETGALREHIRCSGVLKKRRRRMRRHKHKKRLRKNRYKTRR